MVAAVAAGQFAVAVRWSIGKRPLLRWLWISMTWERTENDHSCLGRSCSWSALSWMGASLASDSASAVVGAAADYISLAS